LAALREGGALITTAGAVLESDDVTLHTRLLALAELAASDFSPDAERDAEATDGRPFRRNDSPRGRQRADADRGAHAKGARNPKLKRSTSL
jgi:hypothetical protein